MSGRGGKRPPFPRNPKSTDLTGVLAYEEKEALDTLIADIVAKMARQTSDRFESVSVPFIADNPQHTNIRLSLRPLAITDKENHRLLSDCKLAPDVPLQFSQDASRTFNNTHDNARERRDRKYVPVRHAEPQNDVAPRHQELKKEFQVVFHKWQNILTCRLKDIMVQEPKPESTSRGGRGGRVGRVGRGARSGRGGHGDYRNTGASSQDVARGVSSAGVVRGSAQIMNLNDLDPFLARRFPPQTTWLKTLPMEKKKLLLHLALLVVISTDAYSSFNRVLMLHITSSLHLPLRVLHEDENRLARGLGMAAEDLNLDFVMEQRTTENKKSRKWKAAGHSLIGAVGALAEPLAVAGIGSVGSNNGIGEAAAAKIMGNAAHNGIVVGNILGIYAGRDTGKMIEQYAKDSADFALLPVHGNGEDEYCDSKNIAARMRRMRVAIGLNGWLTKADETVTPFRCLGSTVESFALKYEISNLMSLGTSIEVVIFRSALWTSVKNEMANRSVFSCLMEHKWPLGLLRMSKVVDNPWNIAMVRCEKAGMALAECIGRKIQGDRPVSLVGYSLGARAIYVCLMALAERRQFGLIESVALFGAPIPSDARIWLTMKTVVTGRMVNVYSEYDWLLGFMYRTANLQFGIAGLQPINGVDGIENFNASNLIRGHLRYQYTIGTILKALGWEDLDDAQVVEDEALLAKKDKKLRRKKPPHQPHLPVDETVRPVHKPTARELNELEARMTKMKIQG